MKPSLVRIFLLVFFVLELVISITIYFLYQQAVLPARYTPIVEPTLAKHPLISQILTLTNHVRDMAAQVASHPQTISSLASGSETERLAQQTNVRAFYPDAQIMLLPVDRNTASNFYGAPMSAVHARMLKDISKNSVRTPISANFMLYAAQPVLDAQNVLRGFVVIDQELTELQKLFDNLPQTSGYIELEQFNPEGSHNVLLRHGNETLKTATPKEVVDLPGTAWRLVMWPAAAAISSVASLSQLYWGAWIALTLLLILMMAGIYFVLSRTLRHDLQAILNMFADIRHNRLRKSYTVQLKDMQKPLELMYQLGKLMVGKQKRVASDASLDHLSQVHNRRSFEAKQSALYKTLADGWTHSLLILDIDNFKQVNDTYGHDAGDMLIVQFGKALKDHLRASDFVARLGGDEFCVLFPNTPLKRAMELAHRLRSNMPTLLELSPTVRHTLQWSGGLSEYSKNDSNENLALTRADEALLEAKRSGRNRTQVKIAA